MLPPAIKYILIAMGTMISSAHRSGCKSTRREGRPIIPKNGMKPSVVLPRKFLYFAQNAPADSMIESLRNSVGWSEKGIHGISNQPRAPLILTPNTKTKSKSTITTILITFTCFCHQRYGIFMAITIAHKPIPAWSIFLRIKRQLFGSAILPVSTNLLVIRYES